MKNDTFYEPVAVAEKSIEINLINKASGVYFPGVPVYEGNTLGQILGESGRSSFRAARSTGRETGRDVPRRYTGTA